MNLEKKNDNGNVWLQARQGDSRDSYVQFILEGDCVICILQGEWSIDNNSGSCVREEWNDFLSENPAINHFMFKLHSEMNWDSTLVSFLHKCRKDLQGINKTLKFDELPKGLFQLLELSKPTIIEQKQNEFSLSLELIDETINYFRKAVISFFEFFGEWVLSVCRLLMGRSQARFSDFANSCRACGASALPIVTLISFLTGLTMAFVGSVQLEKFNAKIYVADLVCLAMVREMGALMVAIIMAGRTGASFAAEIGSMKLNEEIDSLRTFGISPMEFLILPRTLSLLLMIPLLTIYADVVGILGGLVVGTVVMDFSIIHYFEQTQVALIGMWEVYSGLLKSVVFGLIIGLVGCYKGLNSGNDSSSLGRAVTAAVVVAVTWIVISDALFEITFSYLDLR
ncbi:MAG: ABC transporter permease [Opitutae bacterium]|jgi:phospholipid/cholesterol/gamma-HCH transport system permease protein|nr:ABC transporter permease [Opitutae bacterium]